MSNLPNLEKPDADERVWLEDIEGEKALQWVAEQREKTAKALAHPSIARDEQALRKALDRPDRIPSISRRGDKVYNFWKDEKHKRGIWRKTTLEQYKEDQGWQVVLDLDELAEKEQEDWVWKGADTIFGTHDIAMISLSRGGKDATVIREYDMEKRAFVKDSAFVLEEAKGSTEWIDRDTLFVNSALGGKQFETDSGYGRCVRVWKRGTDIADAQVIFEIAKESVGASTDIDRSGNHIIFAEMMDFFNNKRHLGDLSGPKTPLDIPTDAAVRFGKDVLLIRLRGAWTLDKEYASDTVMVFSLSGFLDGSRTPTVLHTPRPRTTVDSMSLVDGRVVLHLLDDLSPAVKVWSQSKAGSWSSQEIPGIPKAGVVTVSKLDNEVEESDGTLIVTSEDPLTPRTLSIWKPGDSEITKYRQTGPVFDAKGLCVKRYDATASDGEKIPYFVTGPEGPPTGDAPVLLGGYGGFKISTLPGYNPNTGVLWLAHGGTTVVTCLRGGGEFGTSWHDAGKGPRKIVAQDDFAAVAEDLVKRGITKVSRIAAQGGSNGGLLIANMWTRHPDKFGALSCLIPLVDMRRYNKLLAGASWMSEYGNPDKPDEWEYLRKISAYHLVDKPDGRPPIFVATTRKDDRVHPGHARKFAAKLHECGAPVMYHEPQAGGHGYGADNEQVSQFLALNVRFLRKAIGWEV